MNDEAKAPADDRPRNSLPTAEKSFRGQFAIADLLLALTVVATFTASAVSRSRIDKLQTEIRSLQHAAGELFITDRSQFSAIGKQVIRYSDDAWQVFLPEGATYQLHFVTREVKEAGFPEAKYQTTLTPGLHRIDLRQFRKDKERRFVVEVDEVPELEVPESADWYTSGSSSSVGVGKVQEDASVDKPLVLKRLRQHTEMPNGMSQTPPGDQAVNGLLLWIIKKPKP